MSSWRAVNLGSLSVLACKSVFSLDIPVFGGPEECCWLMLGNDIYFVH